ncbi:MAG: hypothetical protein ACE5HE_03765 [Phycisphaerae bacterium]
MDRNTKILAAVFGGCVIYALYSSFAYPLWIEPLFTIDGRISKRTKVLEKLEAREAKVREAKREYQGYLARIGSFDDVKVQNDLRARINELIARYKLEDASTSKMTPSKQRKTDIVSMRGMVKAVGTVENAVGFLKGLAELPHLIRIGDVSLSAAHSSRRRKTGGNKSERVNISVPFTVWVLPQQRILGERIRDADLKQPEVYVRHEDRDYSSIWTRTHFTEFIPLKPLVAEAGRDLTVEVGRRASLNGSAKGGDGRYEYVWFPADGLADATSPKTNIETTDPGTRTYTLTVTDDSGNSAEDQVTVTIKEKPKPVETPKVVEAKPPPAPPPPDKRWKDRKNLELRMTLMHSEGDMRVQEVMVYNTKSNETVYYPLQAEFDGGTLVGVHPRGGVVRRDEGETEAYYVYPIGETLDEGIPADEAVDFPILQGFALRLRDAELAKLKEEAGKTGSQDGLNGTEGKPASGDAGPDRPSELKQGEAPGTGGPAEGASPTVVLTDGEPDGQDSSTSGELQPGAKQPGTKRVSPDSAASAGDGKPRSAQGSKKGGAPGPVAPEPSPTTVGRGKGPAKSTATGKNTKKTERKLQRRRLKIPAAARQRSKAAQQSKEKRLLEKKKRKTR